MFTYGEHQFDVDVANGALAVTHAGKALPPATLVAMFRRGVTHYLGSEQSSKVTSFFEDVADVTPDQRAGKKAEYVTAAIGAMLAGNVGTATRGPARDPVEAEMEKLARDEVKARLKQNGLAMPTGDNTITFPDGAFTRTQLIEKWVDKHDERLRKEATKIVADNAKRAERVAKAAKEATGKTAADLLGI